MKKLTATIILVLTAGFCLNAHADDVSKSTNMKKGVPVTVKMLVVDVNEMYSKYNKAIEAREKFTQAAENAQKEINDMIQEGMKIGETYNELMAKSNNPALTESAKKKFLDEANEKVKLIEEKQRQITQYQQQAADTLDQRNQSVMKLHLNDMQEVCTKIAKDTGANVVLNKMLVMYVDEKADITQEAIEALNARK